MKKISDRINLFQSAFWQLNSTVCHHAETTIVWDPAYSEPEIQAIHDDAFRSKESNRFLIFTHGDFDHIVGSPQFTDFKKVGSFRLSERADQSRILEQIQVTDHEFYLDRVHQIEFPVLDFPLKLIDPLSIRMGNIEMFFHKAGGHTPDGLFTVIPALQLLVAGDYLSDIEFPFIEDNIEDYYKTLEGAEAILKQYDIKFMVPGHGQPADSKKQIYLRIDQSKRYLDSFHNIEEVPDWTETWGESPFKRYLDKAHQKNISYVRSQRI
ncbi:MAG: MBL fold metallo-hydrolase [Saprospiraceae bacterium]